MSLSNVMTRGVILHFPPKKESQKAQPKIGYVLHEGTYQTDPFADSLVQDSWKHLHGLFL